MQSFYSYCCWSRWLVVLRERRTLHPASDSRGSLHGGIVHLGGIKHECLGTLVFCLRRKLTLIAGLKCVVNGQDQVSLCGGV